MLTRLANAVIALCALACSGQSGPGAVSAQDHRGIPTTCVVAMPFEVSPQISLGAETPELLAAYLVEALGEAGLRVVAPGATGPFRADDDETRGRARAQRIAFAADREFGCDVIALGRVDRFRDRSGEAYGSTQPASVAFDLSFYGAPSGQTLWQGRFDESQKALTENLLRARKYPGGGMRWLSANEFARWGLGEIVRGAPLSPRE